MHWKPRISPQPVPPTEGTSAGAQLKEIAAGPLSKKLAAFNHLMFLGCKVRVLGLTQCIAQLLLRIIRPQPMLKRTLGCRAVGFRMQVCLAVPDVSGNASFLPPALSRSLSIIRGFGLPSLFLWSLPSVSQGAALSYYMQGASCRIFRQPHVANLFKRLFYRMLSLVNRKPNRPNSQAEKSESSN